MITLTDMVKEAQREVALRKVVYAKRVKLGDLTQGQADYHLVVMAEIVRTLQRLEAEQGQLPLFALNGNPWRED